MFKDEIYMTNVDSFAFGLVLYKILVGCPVLSRSMYLAPVMKCILESKMPVVPSRHGEMIKGLILRCWSMNSEDRPSIAVIFDEFQKARFEIVPEPHPERAVCEGYSWLGSQK
jgi:hypothetical protein